MEEIRLEAELRSEIGKGKVKGLRDKGFIPAVIYAEGKESHAIKISHRDLVRLVHQHRLENMVMSLVVKDEQKQKARSCLIKEIQYDPVKGDIVHVDFNEISLTKAIKVKVPITPKGEPVGVKQDGGSLEHILWEIEIECLPTEIPKEIEVDVANLKIGDAVHIREISFPANIKVINDPDAVVLSIASPIKEEVAPAAVEGEEKLEPEVIKKKKEEPGEEKAEEGKGPEKEKEKK